MFKGLVGVTAGALLLALSSYAAAEVSEATRCEIIKLKSVVKELKDKAQCYERSLKTNVPVPESCLARAEQKKARIFERVEERGACRTTTDNDMLSSRIDSFLQDVTKSLGSGGSPASSKSAAASPPSEDKSAKGTEQAKPAATPDGKSDTEATKKKEEE